jgi:hypothetical protein
MAVAITLLLILGLIGLNGSVPERPQFKGGPVMIDVQPEAERTDVTEKPARQKAAAAPTRPVPPPKPVPVLKPPPVPLPVVHPYYIHMTPEETAAADIGKMQRVPMSGNADSQQQASAAGTGPGDARPVGTAPNGEPLYDAEWYRRPTNAELEFYLPKHMPVEGWGLVACKTIANHHVDDCVELGSAPAGSHLASAVRQAAWQFLVRAPRLGGKELVGTWVRIRIDYRTRRAHEAETPEETPTPGGG